MCPPVQKSEMWKSSVSLQHGTETEPEPSSSRGGDCCGGQMVAAAACLKYATAINLDSPQEVVQTGFGEGWIFEHEDLKDVKNEEDANKKTAIIDADISLLRAIEKGQWDKIPKLEIDKYRAKVKDGNSKTNQRELKYPEGRVQLLTVAAQKGLQKLIDHLNSIKEKSQKKAKQISEAEETQKRKSGTKAVELHGQQVAEDDNETQNHSSTAAVSSSNLPAQSYRTQARPREEEEEEEHGQLTDRSMERVYYRTVVRYANCFVRACLFVGDESSPDHLVFMAVAED